MKADDGKADQDPLPQGKYSVLLPVDGNKALIGQFRIIRLRSDNQVDGAIPRYIGGRRAGGRTG